MTLMLFDNYSYYRIFVVFLSQILLLLFVFFIYSVTSLLPTVITITSIRTNTVFPSNYQYIQTIKRSTKPIISILDHTTIQLSSSSSSSSSSSLFESSRRCISTRRPILLLKTTTNQMITRRSQRLQQQQQKQSEQNDEGSQQQQNQTMTQQQQKQSRSKRKQKDDDNDKKDDDKKVKNGQKKKSINTNQTTTINSLPRTIECQVRDQYHTENNNSSNIHIIGIDEAGRGPLAGPVVIAGVILPPNDHIMINGLIDSKQIHSESTREELYHIITNGNIPTIRYSIAIISPKIIDRINILQATLYGMKIVTETLIKYDGDNNNFITTNEPHQQQQEEDDNSNDINNQHNDHIIKTYHINNTNEIKEQLLSYIDGIDCCILYHEKKNGIVLQHHDNNLNDMIDHQDNVIVNCNENKKDTTTLQTSSSLSSVSNNTNNNINDNYYCLIDGNRIPNNMSCNSKSIIGGDSKEYCIAMASILAKVTRDYIMNLYDIIYPIYQFKHNKGYPTLYHRTIIQQQQYISPIHRRTFAPMKHNTYDTITGHIIIINNTKSNTAPNVPNIPIKKEKVTNIKQQKNGDNDDNDKDNNKNKNTINNNSIPESSTKRRKKKV